MSLKPVIILDETLPIGLQANVAAVLGMSLGRLRPDLIGADTITQDGTVLAGITTVALPILGAPPPDLPPLFDKAAELPLRFAYVRAAFDARDYSDYTSRIAAETLAGHTPHALLLAGPRKAVDRICGRLRLLR